MFRLTRLASVCCFALLFAAHHDAHARGGPGNKTFGLGVQLGVPLGITGKVYLGEGPSLEFGFGGLLPYGGLGGWIDFEYQFFHIRQKREDILKLYLYAGIGLQLGASGYYYSALYSRPYVGPIVNYYVAGPALLGVHPPFGCTIHWSKVSFDTFVEIAPTFMVVLANPAGFFFGMQGVVGGRYYF